MILTKLDEHVNEMMTTAGNVTVVSMQPLSVYAAQTFPPSPFNINISTCARAGSNYVIVIDYSKIV